MSYILDALRRAQAERDRGQVPGLHAQPLAAPATGPGAYRPPTLWLAGAGVLLLVLLAGSWLLRWPAGGAASSPQPEPAGHAPAVQPGAAGFDGARVPGVASSDSVPMPPAPAPATTASRLPQVVSASPQPLTAPAQVPLQRDAPARVPGQAPAPSSAEGGEAQPLASLSADQRRAFPQLVVGGSVWSENRSARFVLINGQLVHEGDAAGPELMLERISPKSMLVRWRGMLIAVPL